MIEVIRQTIMITSLVLVMMLFIEYINVISKGNWGEKLAKSKFKQLVVSALLGLIPGCIGGFAVVSMFTHNFINFGALTAAMIASTGDESFVMFSMFPEKALLLNVFLFALAIGVGLLVNLFVKSIPSVNSNQSHIKIHSHEFAQPKHSIKQIRENLRNISFSRFVLLMGLLLFLFGIITGQFEHAAHETQTHPVNNLSEHLEFGFETLLFTMLPLLVLYILLVVDEHFLEEHLWEHIIKKHFLRIFLWTFGALFAIELLNQYVNITPWLQQNRVMVLVAAVLVGLIPQSGPNLVFVSLFFSGTIPFSILFANSIVQDGHSTLPLFAESKRSFLLVKGINMVVALLFGLLGFWMGW
jgi:hypothetical protein